MPSKKNKNKKEAASAAEPDDWEVSENPLPSTEPPPAPPAAEAASEAAPAAAPDGAPVDAAAAYLAAMGLGVAGGEKKKDDKKDKKKKGKKKPGAAAEKEGEDEEAEKEAPKKPLTAAGKALAARQAALREEEERRAKAEAEERARVEELERKEAEEAARIEAEKEAKKQKAADKIARQKAEGTYKTKAQKEKERAAQARLEAMKAAGMTVDLDAAKQKAKAKPVYGNKKKDKGKKKDEAPAPEPAESEAAKPAVASPEGEAGGDDWEAEADKRPEAEEVADAWEEVAESWDDGELAVPTIAGLEEAKLSAKQSGEEDLADLEAKELEAKEAEAAEARRRRAAEAAAQKEAKDKAKQDALKLADTSGKGEKAGAGLSGMMASEPKEGKVLSKAEQEALEAKLEARGRRKAREAENEKLRTTEKLRCPVVCIMGHVDTGKTKLLDKIRRTNVQDGEAGGITQQIGATFFPGTTLEEKTGKLNRLINMELKLPGMLVIDTPGHEAFANLRNRGSSICDIAILVIDLMHGLEQQTIESIEMLRKKKCPFVVALNKVDRCYGWKEFKDLEFRESLAQQDSATKDEFMHRMKQARVQLMEKGLNAELYWDNKELGSTVSLVPTSAITGEGVNDLLHMLARLSQKHLAEKLSFSPNLQCTVLEVKVIDGLGCTVDVILVNGSMDNGASIVVCTTDGPVVTQVRALLTPPPNRELRVKSQYIHHEHLEGAVGIKICAVGLENAVAGSPVMVVGPDDDVEDLKEEVMSDFSKLATALATDTEGVLAVASTLGALEALLVFLRNECSPPIPVSAVSIGPVFKREVMRAELMHHKKKPEYATILAFDVAIDPDARAYADENKVKIFTADIIYHLFDNFVAHRTRTMEEEKEKAKDLAVFPCLVNILPNAVFNQKDPIIVGVEVTDGILKVGTPLCVPKNGFVHVGRVASIESNNVKVDKIRKGQQCAISIVNEGNPGMTFGRQFNGEHALYSELNRHSIDALKKYFKDEMTDPDWRLVIKMKKVFSII